MSHDHALPPGTAVCRLFVYGTLRSGQPNAPRLGGATFLGMGTTSGKLIHLGDYPALVPGDGTVIGELYELPLAALTRIDELEGFDPADPEGSLFLRVERPVQLDGHSESELALTYLWPHSSQAPVLEEGDWVAYLQRTRGGYAPVPWL
ncbi:MAG: gamma-glutamylcyclotransferase [Fibrobacteres bacterium]|jgi:gamma-glutamylcyclotransferase (GGCT)/AIG2-like uncharacterized protein YtfP|nr:gamma-glutamylcyclotransferase [Fibrobacterota bacterium]